jgi:hypothetical protein
LNRMTSALEAGDSEQLEKIFLAARTLRAGWTLK